MGWRLVRQPNGTLARFSEVVDDFTDYNLTDREAWKLCRDSAGYDVADQKLESANDHPDRFEKTIGIIGIVHGARHAAVRRRQLSAETTKGPDDG